MNEERELSKEEWMKRNREEDERWESSCEGIHYNLNIMPEAYDEEIELAIAKTLQKVPKKVREKILDDKVIFFLMQGNGLATRILFKEVFNKDQFEKLGRWVRITHEKPMIVLNTDALIEEAEFYQMSVIAHEIAHIILGHYEGGKKGGLHDQERAADDLAEKWGFERGYKSYEHFEKFDHAI